MTNKLISLVIIMLFLSVGRSFSEDQFLFPKEKPSIFKKLSRMKIKIFQESASKKPLISPKED